MNVINYFKTRLVNQYIRTFIYPKSKRKIQNIRCYSIDNTITNLINSNKSLSRFGDGEMRRVVGQENLHVQKADQFEKNSDSLREHLLKVLRSHIPNLKIGIPTIYNGFSNCTFKSRRFCKLLIAEYGVKFAKYLNSDEQYYNSEFSRFYIGGNDRNKSTKRFSLIKEIWKNKNLLIIEGRKCRVGLGNDLFNSARSVRRIECPSTNAFESYNTILMSTLHFLHNNSNTLSLITLGPTATILSYDLAKRGYRAIDIGQLDIEYEWYLMHATHRINIPDRYVSEVSDGDTVSPIHNKEFLSEIYYNIR